MESELGIGEPIHRLVGIGARGSVASALAKTPLDDEPVATSDAEAIAEGERDVKDGRVVSAAELRVRLGL